MAVPVVDWNWNPESSHRPGGPGLDAAARQYWERQKREAKERQMYYDSASQYLPTTIVDTSTTAAEPAARNSKRGSQGSVDSTSSNTPKSEKRRSFWKSITAVGRRNSGGNS